MCTEALAILILSFNRMFYVGGSKLPLKPPQVPQYKKELARVNVYGRKLPNSPDLNDDDMVNFKDLALLAQEWLERN